MESEKQSGVKEKVEDKHSLVFFICAWLGVGGYLRMIESGNLTGWV